MDVVMIHKPMSVELQLLAPIGEDAGTSKRNNTTTPMDISSGDHTIGPMNGIWVVQLQDTRIIAIEAHLLHLLVKQAHFQLLGDLVVGSHLLRLLFAVDSAHPLAQFRQHHNA